MTSTPSCDCFLKLAMTKGGTKKMLVRKPSNAIKIDSFTFKIEKIVQ